MVLSKTLLLVACWALSVHAALSSSSQGDKLPRVLTAPFAAKDPTDFPPPISRITPTTVEVDLVAQEIITEIEAGKKAWIWTFNGTVPGPMIRAMEGDTVKINLHNAKENIEPHNIDLHASMGPGGGGRVTSLKPGDSTTFSFKALREGSFIYHCAAEGAPWEHVAYGMMGLIVVEPPGGLPKVDKEFYIGQSDWYHSYMDPNFLPHTHGNEDSHDDPEAPITDESGAVVSEASVSHGNIRQRLLLKRRMTAINLGEDVQVLNEDMALNEHPTLYTFNGHKDALTDPALYGNAIQTDQNDTVRFLVVNGGPNVGSNFHIIGTIFDTVYTGRSLEQQRYEETVYIAPGSGMAIELGVPVPGEYLIVDHSLFRAAKGAAGVLHVTAPVGAPWPHHIYSPDPSTVPELDMGGGDSGSEDVEAGDEGDGSSAAPGSITVTLLYVAALLTGFALV